ncbi:T-cell-interacting, activating receptor on myeloid cells protein 1-like isoform X2 [Eumetopias jubatus]|uniref:T-cell-interacting, activating receptor on myeloid cells protein 1-like isoform X2 n=1 Tax=Eumetopias jubatus TaxID=34886 RepID=UPI001016EA8C|nr:T-cell-interacting, activating receptor on myeloid cells protein 1-like isoform X2 [Eumetopias jubatus]
MPGAKLFLHVLESRGHLGFSPTTKLKEDPWKRLVGATMMPQLLALLCTGLCAGQGSRTTDESLPKPSLRAWPSSVVPRESNVTLQCQTSTKNVNFVLRKGKVPLQSVQSRASTEGLAEFHLTDLKTDNAGEYSCEYYRLGSPSVSSRPSDVLLLLVTGELSKPFLQAHPRGEVNAGDTVTLQCQRPDNIFAPVMFALLKAGAAEPIRVQSPAGKETDFSLRTVTVSDAGNYSCVYFQTGIPFWASHPSDHLEIQVTDKTERKSPKMAETELGTTGITLIVIFIFLFLLGTFLICKYTRCGAAPDKMTKRSHSKEPEEMGTSIQPEKENDPPAATTNCSPASGILDPFLLASLEIKTSQVSRAEEPHGVTYAELNTRALSEGPSSQMEQPLETCVYSTLMAKPGKHLEPGKEELPTRGWMMERGPLRH